MQETLDRSELAGIDLSSLENLQRGEELSPLRFSDPAEDKWRKDRLGMITGSQFGKLVVRSKDRKGYTLSKGEVATKLIYRIAWERLLSTGNISNGLGRLDFSSPSVEHGHEFEAEAVMKYTERTGNRVDYHQEFITHGKYIGGTPDGYIGKDGLIEVKCPWDGGNHIRGILTGEVYNQEYIYQMQGYLWLTRRKWCDFVTYDPDLNEAYQLNIIRVYRDEEIIRGIQEVLAEVKKKIQSIMRNRKLR